jgi:hypothetical protein
MNEELQCCTHIACYLEVNDQQVPHLCIGVLQYEAEALFCNSWGSMDCPDKIACVQELLTLPGVKPAAPLTMKNNMPSHCSRACASKKSMPSLLPPLSAFEAGTPNERCVPDPSIAWRRLRWKPGMSEYDTLRSSSRFEARMCSRSRIERACSRSLRADGLNQASRSAAGKDVGM